MLEIMSLPRAAGLRKVQKTSAATSKRRMANVLDAVLETTKALSQLLQRKSLQLKPNRRPKLKLSKQKSKLHKFKLKPKLGL
jgi:dsDNA-binding SOS-regulon protein